jgi:rhamnogalacturonan endolyase
MKHTFILCLFFLAGSGFPCFSQSVKIANADFTAEKSGWSEFGREADALSFIPDRLQTHILYTGQKDWAVSNATKIPVLTGEIYRLSCSAMSSETQGHAAALALVTMNKGKVKNYRGAQTAPFSTPDWTVYTAIYTVSAGTDAFYIRLSGSGQTDIRVKDIQIEKITADKVPPAIQRNEKLFSGEKLQPLSAIDYPDKMNRDPYAIPAENGGIFISWRLLKSDTVKTTFSLTRTRDGKTTPVTDKPLNGATCFIDQDGLYGDIYTIIDDKNTRTQTTALPVSYKKIPLIDQDGAEKISITDLDGDGTYDFVAKCSAGNIDPGYYVPSKNTYSLQAYHSDGTFMWKKDLGWNIESGTWYSPYLCADLDGDGCAEVIVKTGDDTSSGEKDWRGIDGRVQTGPEYISVLDGKTGKERTRAAWIPREGFEDYNRTSRNQIAIARLDGNTPCIIMIRGTYGLMKVSALMFDGTKNQLIPVWSYSNEFLPENTKGQGAHYTICADIDNDGRDEIILGSIVLDDNGSILWTTGRGHPDGVYYGDIDTDHEGNEIAYLMETKQLTGGFCVVDALTGKEIWASPFPTNHIHSRGFCADIDASHPGREIYGQNCIYDHQYDGKRWLFTGSGTILKDGPQLDQEHNKWGFGPLTAYWDESGQKSFIDNKKIRYNGTIIMCADILGDWREEIVTATKNEIRIYGTNIPSTTRRTCLMQEPEYRAIVTMDSNGYLQCPDTIAPVLPKK